MPESFDGMLAELADAVAAATALPDAAAVRRRARERTVRRRLVASALALAVLAACGGTFAAVAARRPAAHGVGALNAPAGAVPTAAGPASSSPASAPADGTATPLAGSSAETSGTGAYAAAAGLWQLVGGQRELLVYPDGDFGIGQSGRWALCDGRLKPLKGATEFTVAALACSDYGTVGLSLRVEAAGKLLTLNAPGARLTYRLVAAVPAPATSAATAIAIKELTGSWRSMDKSARGIVMLPGGYADFQQLANAGGGTPISGRITGYFAGVVRVEVPCAKPVAPGLAYCQVFQLGYDPKGLLDVVGGLGTELFAPADGSVP